jgi:hypothetical protein
MSSTGSGNVRPMTIDGKHFELSLCEQPHANSWHWIIAAPGELVLSGEATSEMQALHSACRAGRALARLAAA